MLTLRPLNHVYKKQLLRHNTADPATATLLLRERATGVFISVYDQPFLYHEGHVLMPVRDAVRYTPIETELVQFALSQQNRQQLMHFSAVLLVIGGGGRFRILQVTEIRGAGPSVAYIELDLQNGSGSMLDGSRKTLVQGTIKHMRPPPVGLDLSINSIIYSSMLVLAIVPAGFNPPVPIGAAIANTLAFNATPVPNVVGRYTIGANPPLSIQVSLGRVDSYYNVDKNAPESLGFGDVTQFQPYLGMAIMLTAATAPLGAQESWGLTIGSVVDDGAHRYEVQRVPATDTITFRIVTQGIPRATLSLPVALSAEQQLVFAWYDEGSGRMYLSVNGQGTEMIVPMPRGMGVGWPQGNTDVLQTTHLATLGAQIDTLRMYDHRLVQPENFARMVNISDVTGVVIRCLGPVTWLRTCDIEASMVAAVVFNEVIYGAADTALDISVPTGFQILNVAVVADTSSVSLEALFSTTEVIEMAECTLF